MKKRLGTGLDKIEELIKYHMHEQYHKKASFCKRKNFLK